VGVHPGEPFGESSKELLDRHLSKGKLILGSAWINVRRQCYYMERIDQYFTLFNLFLHCVFDVWMKRNYPELPLPRSFVNTSWLEIENVVKARIKGKVNYPRLSTGIIALKTTSLLERVFRCPNF